MHSKVRTSYPKTYQSNGEILNYGTLKDTKSFKGFLQFMQHNGFQFIKEVCCRMLVHAMSSPYSTKRYSQSKADKLKKPNDIHTCLLNNANNKVLYQRIGGVMLVWSVSGIFLSIGLPVEDRGPPS